MANQALKGQFTIKVLEGDTVVKELVQTNTITDVGSDLYAQFNVDSLLKYCAIGSDDTTKTPVVYQEVLGNEVARIERDFILREDPNNDSVDFVANYFLPASDPGFIPSWNAQIISNVPLTDTSGSTAVAIVGSNGTYINNFTLNQDDGFGDFSNGAPSFNGGGVRIPVNLFPQFVIFFRVKIQLGTANILTFEGDRQTVCLGLERDTINLVFNDDVFLKAKGLTLDTWYTVGIVVDRAVCSLYIDGVQRDSRTTRKNFPSIPGNLRFGDETFFGQFSDIVVANTFLTSAQVEEYTTSTNRRLPENQELKEIGVSPYPTLRDRLFSRAIITPLLVAPTQTVLIEYRLTIEILTISTTASTNQGTLTIVDEMQSKLGAIDLLRGGVLSPLTAGFTDIILTTVGGLSSPTDGLVLHTDGTELTREVNSTQDISQYLRAWQTSYTTDDEGSSTYSTLSTIDPEHGAAFVTTNSRYATLIFKRPLTVYGFIITGFNNTTVDRGTNLEPLTFTIDQVSGESYNFNTTDFGAGLGQFAQNVTALNDGLITNGTLLNVGVNMAQSTFRFSVTFSEETWLNEITLYNGQGNGAFNVFDTYRIYQDSSYSTLLYEKTSGVNTTTEVQNLSSVAALDVKRSVYYIELAVGAGSISVREIEFRGTTEPSGIGAIANGEIYYRESLSSPLTTALTIGAEIDKTDYRYVYYFDPIQAQVISIGDLSGDWSQVASVIPLVFENNSYANGQYIIEKPLEVPPVLANTVDGGIYRDQSGSFNSLQLTTRDVYPSIDAVNPRSNVGYAAQFTPPINLTNSSDVRFFSRLAWGDATISSDSDVLDYLNALASDDVSIDVAISYLVTELKNEGLWNKLDVIYPILDNQILNLKNPTNLEESVLVSGNYLVSRRGIQIEEGTLLELPTVTLSGLLGQTLIINANLSLDSDNILLSAKDTEYALDVNLREINLIKDSKDLQVVNKIPTDGLVTWITPGNADATVQPVMGFGEVGVYSTLTSALGLNPTTNDTQYLVTPGLVGYPGIWIDFNPITWSGLMLGTQYTVFIVLYRPVGSGTTSNVITVSGNEGTITLKPQNTTLAVIDQTTETRNFNYNTTENVVPGNELVLVTFRGVGGASRRYNKQFDGFNIPLVRKNGTDIIDDTSESGTAIGTGLTGFPQRPLTNATLTLDGEMVLYDFLYYDYDMSDEDVIAVEKALSEKHNLNSQLNIRQVQYEEDLDVNSNTYYLENTSTTSLIYKNNISTALLRNDEITELTPSNLLYESEGNIVLENSTKIEYVHNNVIPAGYVRVDSSSFAVESFIYDSLDSNSDELANFGQLNVSGVFIYDSLDFNSNELSNITISSGIIYDSMDFESDELVNLSGAFTSSLYYELDNPALISGFNYQANILNSPLYYEYSTAIISGIGFVPVGSGDGAVTTSGIFLPAPLYYEHSTI